MDEWKPCDIRHYKLVVPCKGGNHEIALRVEKYFDSMWQDSDHVLVCDDVSVELVCIDSDKTLFDLS
ncbi:MAG: hypothetical protein Q7S12_02610 [bacterium]|nr:hypothetical protein [bacterium]